MNKNNSLQLPLNLEEKRNWWIKDFDIFYKHWASSRNTGIKEHVGALTLHLLVPVGKKMEPGKSFTEEVTAELGLGGWEECAGWGRGDEKLAVEAIGVHPTPREKHEQRHRPWTCPVHPPKSRGCITGPLLFVGGFLSLSVHYSPSSCP